MPMRVGIITKHGGQLVDEISKMTGVLEWMISLSKLLSLTFTIRISSSVAFAGPLACAGAMPPTARIVVVAIIAMLVTNRVLKFFI